MKETLVSLSRKIGYSPTTISRVLNGKAAQYRIPPETVKDILAEVEKYGYAPKAYAQTLMEKGSNTIGLLLPSLSNPYFATIADFVIDEARRHGYTAIVMDTMEDESNQNDAINTLLSKQVEGIIVAPCGKSPELLERINRESIPVILVDRYYSSTDLPYVTTNNYLGGYQGAKVLLENGHRNIVCLQGAMDSMPNQKRVEGYMAALKEYGCDTGRVLGHEFSVKNGYIETKMLLGEDNPPTAIFALSNMILLGAIKALREAGVRIPEDVSLISFDDSLFLDYITPPISRISQPVEDMSLLAAKVLFDSIRTGRRSSNSMQLYATLIPGASVAKL